MTNIWDFIDADRLSITTKDGQVYIGRKAGIFDAEEINTEEDCIDIQLSDGRIIGFTQSEIKSIVEMK